MKIKTGTPLKNGVPGFSVKNVKEEVSYVLGF
jgi:hypothetical protein